MALQQETMLRDRTRFLPISPILLASRVWMIARGACIAALCLGRQIRFGVIVKQHNLC